MSLPSNIMPTFGKNLSRCRTAGSAGLLLGERPNDAPTERRGQKVMGTPLGSAAHAFPGARRRLGATSSRHGPSASTSAWGGSVPSHSFAASRKSFSNESRAATASIFGHLWTLACSADLLKRAGAPCAFEAAECRMNPTAAAFLRPPTSKPNTTSLHRCAAARARREECQPTRPNGCRNRAPHVWTKMPLRLRLMGIPFAAFTSQPYVVMWRKDLGVQFGLLTQSA